MDIDLTTASTILSREIARYNRVTGKNVKASDLTFRQKACLFLARGYTRIRYETEPGSGKFMLVNLMKTVQKERREETHHDRGHTQGASGTK